jgi:hypothetical protein
VSSHKTADEHLAARRGRKMGMTITYLLNKKQGEFFVDSFRPDIFLHPPTGTGVKKGGKDS